MNMQLNEAANYTAALNFNSTSDWLLDWSLEIGAEGEKIDWSGIYVILEFAVNDPLAAAVIESEREKVIDALEKKRFKLLTELQGLYRENALKIKELEQKRDASSKKWLYTNNIKKLIETLEQKKERIRAKLEKNRQKIDKKEAFFHKKLSKVAIRTELNTYLMRFRKGKSDLIESFFEKI